MEGSEAYVATADRPAYSRKREKQLVIRLTESERDGFEELAQRLGVSVSEAVRAAVYTALFGEQMREHYEAMEAAR